MSRIIVSLLLNYFYLFVNCQQNPASPSLSQLANLVAVVETENEPSSKSQFEFADCLGNECSPRLLSKIQIHHYDLHYIYNNVNNSIVQGKVSINFTLFETTDEIIYHGKRLLNLSETILIENGHEHRVDMHLYAPLDYIVLRSLSNTSLFSPNNYLLKQNFSVNLLDGNVGFYQALYKDADGKREKILATKFQPTDARKAFPCFDEPQLKAVFKITIDHPINTIALSNFPKAKETIENNLIRSIFDETFPMSTYLAAWAILPDNYGKLVGDVNDKPINVWARQKPTQQGHTAFALEIATKSVNFFIDYFNTSVPLTPKIDLLAVPDFSSGAMENWGLISFREDRIILDEKVVSSVQKQYIAETIAHEVAHFWFGNYVTCKWWDDLWLNEAMATWLAFKPFTEHYTDWNMDVQVLTEDLIPVMWDDSKPSSHPVRVANVSRATEITSLFDLITYSKGASILRMLEKIVGFDVFRDSLRDFLESNAFNVGDPTSFYNRLFTNISGEEFLQNWLDEANFPILRVQLNSNENGTEIHFSQSRFIISNALDASMLNSNYRWKINVECFLGVFSDDESFPNKTIEFIFESERETIWLENEFYDWIKCNRNFQGFFVTFYSSTNSNVSLWQRFSSLIERKSTIFSVEDKVNILHDSFLLAYKGLIDYIEPLKIWKSIVRSGATDYVLWRTFQWHCELLAELIEYLPETWPSFQNFAIDQILSSGSNVTEILQNNSNDTHSEKMLKGLKFSLLCRLRHQEAIDYAHTLFRSIPEEYFLKQNVEINFSADFLSTVYVHHLANDENAFDWTTMYNYYRNAISPQEQIRALNAICSTKNKNRLNRLLHDGLSNGGSIPIKRQDFFSLLGYMSRHPIGREVAWSFYKRNFQRMVQIFTLENRRLGTVLSAISRSFENPSYLEDLLAFIKQNPKAGAGANPRKMAIDQVNMNLEWIQYREENIRQALEDIKNY